MTVWLATASQLVCHPKHLVDGEAVHLECGDGVSDVAQLVVHTLDVRWLVMDELSGQPLTERRVRPRVENERVPADVNQR